MSDVLNRLLARGVITRTSWEAGMALVQARFGDTEIRTVELPQPYGFGSLPMPGAAEVFAGFAKGDRSAGVALAYDDRENRPVFITSGEVLAYGPNWQDAFKHWIHFTNQPKPGTIKVKAARVEFRYGDYYSLWDSDPAIGVKAGTYPHAAELPLNPP
jgi:hypothetical protein